MSAKQAVGAMMVSAPFVAIGAYCYAAGGPLAVVTVFGATALIGGLLVGGIALLDTP